MATGFILFAIISLTDPLTIESFLSCYKVPKKLQNLPHYESIFNDIVAFVIYAIGLVLLSTYKHPNLLPGSIFYEILRITFGSVFLGIFLGFLTAIIFRYTTETVIETSVFLLGIYTAFTISENLHLSAVLTLITTTITTFSIVQYSLKKDPNPAVIHILQYSRCRFFEVPIMTPSGRDGLYKNMEHISTVLSGLIFISVASNVNFQSFWIYRHEIIYLLIFSTLLRAIFMLKFFPFNKKNKKNFSLLNEKQGLAWALLTFLGNKGVISILLTHMIPNQFFFKPMFETIILGMVVLSTLIYALFLVFLFFRYDNHLANE